MIFSLHIPKCAGTSFRLWLKALFGDELMYDYTKRWEKRHQAELKSALKDKVCFHAHASFDALDGLYPKLYKVTWLRDPVQRVLSYYNHIISTRDMANGHFRFVLENRLSVEEFAGLPWVRNGMLQYIGGSIDEFAFVGIVEYSQTSLGLLERLLKETCDVAANCDFPSVNRRVDSDPCQMVKPTSRQLRTISELNREDIKLYEIACRSLGV